MPILHYGSMATVTREGDGKKKEGRLISDLGAP